MAQGFFGSCSKIILFLLNLLVFIVGIVLLAVGIWMLADDNSQHYFDIARNPDAQHAFRTACIVTLCLGVLIALISFCGCCGAIKENNCLLMTYAVILAVFLVIEVTAGILAAVFKNDISKEIGKAMQKTVKEDYGRPDRADVTKSWDSTQRDLKCCGSYGPEDYQGSFYTTNTSNSVPESCCVMSNGKPLDSNKCLADASRNATQSDYLHTKGCGKVLKDWVHENADILIGVTFGLAAVLLFGVVCACCLSRRLSPARRGYEYV